MQNPYEVEDFEYVCHPAYVKNQVIVTGRKTHVEEVVRAAFDDQEASPQETPVELDRRFPLPKGRFPVDQDESVIIALYDTGNLSVTEAIGKIYDAAVKLELPVYPDPNLVTGHPHIPVGSPHIPVGSPHIPVGSPATTAGMYLTEGHFWRQPAFSADWGIGLTTIAGVRWNELDDHCGEGIHVGIFDTSPFVIPPSQPIQEITPPLVLDVRNLLGPAHSQTGTADHGLFVASLVHAVAPASTKYLFQVLDEKAEGTLYTLIQALFQFMDERLVANNDLSKTVMNLSLGLDQPPDPGSFELDSLLVLHSRLCNELGISGSQQQTPGQMVLVSLETVLGAADQLRAIVVAAAGNASNAHLIKPPEVPAEYRYVTGVAASNKHRGRSCFSNRGDVAAPGGDSRRPGTPACVPQLVDHWDSVVIGLVLNTAPQAGYAYACWAGTSFSTPLVSGLMALMLEDQGTAQLGRISVKSTVPPQDPSLGVGIIDVLSSLP